MHLLLAAPYAYWAVWEVRRWRRAARAGHELRWCGACAGAAIGALIAVVWAIGKFPVLQALTGPYYDTIMRAPLELAVAIPIGFAITIPVGCIGAFSGSIIGTTGQTLLFKCRRFNHHRNVKVLGCGNHSHSEASESPQLLVHNETSSTEDPHEILKSIRRRHRVTHP